MREFQKSYRFIRSFQIIVDAKINMIHDRIIDKWILFSTEQVLNLFLALLLSNFGSSNLSAPTADNDTNKIAEAIDRIARFIKWIKRNVLYIAKLMRAKFTNQISDQAPGEGPSNSWKEGLYPIRSLAVCAV